MNNIGGSVPAAAGGNFVRSNLVAAALLVLDPMNKDFGLCGIVPPNMNVVSANLSHLQALPQRQCPGMSRVPAVLTSENAEKLSALLKDIKPTSANDASY